MIGAYLQQHEPLKFGADSFYMNKRGKVAQRGPGCLFWQTYRAKCPATVRSSACFFMRCLLHGRQSTELVEHGGA